MEGAHMLQHILEQLHNFVTTDAIGKLTAGILGAIFSGVLQWYLKRNRLRSAIRIEVSLMTDNMNKTFSSGKMLAFRNHVINTKSMILPMSRKLIVLDNISDEIAYVSKDVAKKIIIFADDAHTLLDTVHALNGQTFNSYTTEEREKYFDYIVVHYDKFKESSKNLLDVL
jgi:hypothetical protein